MGDESDADWDAALVEWGRETMERITEEAIFGGARTTANNTSSTGLTLDNIREAMGKFDFTPACPFREVICNERMRADARVVRDTLPSSGLLGGVPVRYSNMVPDGYIVLSDGKNVVAIIGPEKPK